MDKHENSIKIPATDLDYRYLGHGYNARNGKFVDVQLFKDRPIASINKHPQTKLYYED
jgi:hypothetical protein